MEKENQISNNIINTIPNKISILSKIKHKPLLLFEIFPFVANRPYILPYLIDNDYILKKSLKKSISKINQKNFPSKSIDNLYRFISYKLFQEINIQSFIKYILKNILLNFKFCDLSLKDNYNKFFLKYFKILEPQDINISNKIISKYIPSELILEKFIEDFLSNEMCLFYLPLNRYGYDNNDSIYLYNLNKKIK